MKFNMLTVMSPVKIIKGVLRVLSAFDFKANTTNSMIRAHVQTSFKNRSDVVDKKLIYVKLRILRRIITDYGIIFKYERWKSVPNATFTYWRLNILLLH